jgi:hypothetical protein
MIAALVAGLLLGATGMWWLMTWRPWDSPDPKRQSLTAGELADRHRNPEKSGPRPGGTTGRGGQ